MGHQLMPPSRRETSQDSHPAAHQRYRRTVPRRQLTSADRQRTSWSRRLTSPCPRQPSASAERSSRCRGPPESCTMAGPPRYSLCRVRPLADEPSTPTGRLAWWGGSVFSGRDCCRAGIGRRYAHKCRSPLLTPNIIILLVTCWLCCNVVLAVRVVTYYSSVLLTEIGIVKWM